MYPLGEPIIICKVNGIFHLPRLPRPFVLNGRRHDSKAEGIFADAPETLSLIQNRRVITHYESEDGERLEADAFDALDSDMRNPRTIDPETREWISLDAEYAWRKFVDRWKAVRTDEEYEQPVPFAVHDITGDTSNPYIVPLRLLGKPSLKDGEVLYRYTPAPMDFARTIAEKYGFRFVDDREYGTCVAKSGRTWTVPGHSQKDLDFLQLSGNYYRRNWNFCGVYPGTWDECTERYEQHMQQIEDAFSDADLRLRAVGETLDAASVAAQLSELSGMVSRISVRAKSDVTPREVANKIERLRIDILHKAAAQEASNG